jgi:hypothetical protein
MKARRVRAALPSVVTDRANILETHTECYQFSRTADNQLSPIVKERSKPPHLRINNLGWAKCSCQTHLEPIEYELESPRTQKNFKI